MKAGLSRIPLAALFLCGGLLGGQGPASRRSRLEAVPFPPLAQLEPAVAEQIRSLEVDLDTALKSSSTSDAALAETFGDFGKVFHAYEIWSAAAVSYRNAATLSPTDFRWKHLLADVETRRGDLESARRQHLAALALRPGDVPSLAGLGEACLAHDQLDESERAFHEAVVIAPNSAAPHAGLARVALARRAFAPARDELLTALRLAPQATRLHYELAMAYRGLGEREEAARHLAAAGTVGVRAADPLLDGVSGRRQGERARLVRGRLAFVNGRMREAAEEFGAAVEAEPRSVAGLVGLGSALGTLGETDRALEAFRRALAIAPDSVAAHYNVGRLLATRGDTESALREYDAVLRLAPNDEDAFLSKADLLARLGRFAEARAALEEGSRRMPGHVRLGQALASLLAAWPDASRP
ncbi:MAG: tetratricopeptide repeat protein [Thermoanaerobaculia bacterium]|nr:tetratricopeptide repeat protein [Thermoanaerobaculia bacterium]